MPLPTIKWQKDHVIIIDQTRLPLEKKIITINSKEEMWDAIKKLKIRGAPAIGIAAAFGVYLGIRDFDGTIQEFIKKFNHACEYLASSRPTAVNLFWALKRLKKIVEKNTPKPVKKLQKIILNEAISMIDEDNKVCGAIGKNGVRLIKNGFNILTHCNAGGLATAMYGTALAPMFRAKELEINFHVYVDETRPLLQGARLTAWELLEAGIPATLITDNMAASVMASGRVNLVIVGADRIAANGDTANKIGTLGVAVLAKEFDIPFYIAAPVSTFDPNTPTGGEIPIEERAKEEITTWGGIQIAPSGINVYNPAFDVTPYDYIKGFITEKGIITPPYKQKIKKILNSTE